LTRFLTILKIVESLKPIAGNFFVAIFFTSRGEALGRRSYVLVNSRDNA
jgi:hypothetical protein